MNMPIKQEVLDLVGAAKIAYVSSVDGDGFPNTKAMLALQHDDLSTHYFSTNLSAKRTQQFQHNPRACVYFCNESKYMGLMLVGTMEVLTDREHKALLWRENFEMYYPDGIDTADYCVLKFTAHKANYYHGLQNSSFTMEDFYA